VVTFGYSENNYGALLQDVWVPPYKRRSIRKALFSSIFSNFNRVAFLEISQALPSCSPIFPLNTQVPNFGCFSHFLIAAMLGVHISRINGMSICIAINNAFHKIVFSAFNITLGMHILCTHIGGIFITTVIRKLHFISSYIQH
jgi:hypothetical protein